MRNVIAAAKSSVLIVDNHPLIRHGLAKLIGQEEDLDRRPAGGVSSRGYPFNQHGLHALAHMYTARQDFTNGSHDRSGGFLFHYISPSPRPQCALRVQSFTVHREDQHQHFRPAGAHPLHKLESISTARRYLDNRQFWNG